MARAASLRAFEIAAKNALLERKRELDEGLLRVDWFAGECRIAPLAFVCHCYVLFHGGVGRAVRGGARSGRRGVPTPLGGGGGAAHGDSWGKMGQALFRLIFNKEFSVCNIHLLPDREGPGRPWC